MMFSGGEIGIERLLPELAKAKRSNLWLKGEIHWWTKEDHPDALFGVSRRFENKEIVTLVNFSNEAISMKNQDGYKLKARRIEIGDEILVDSSVINLPPFAGAVLELEIG
jgi:hypothetical protein